MRGKIVFALVVMLTLVCMGTLGIGKVSAWTPTGPAVYVTWDLYSYKEVGDRVGVWDPLKYNYAMAVVKVYLPHVTHEPAEPGDMTWQGRVDITWDPTVLTLEAADLYRPGLWTTLDPTTPGLWSQWNYWTWAPTPLPARWKSIGSYSVTYIPVVDTAAGTASVTTGLLAPSPTDTLLPANWHTQAVKAPDYGYHDGLNYDLPWTPNTIWPAHTAGKGIYEDHVWLMFRVLKDSPSDYSKVDIPFVRFLTYGGTEITMEKVAGWYGAKPVPEFPLGLGFIMLLAPAIPIVYLWRMRKKSR